MKKQRFIFNYLNRIILIPIAALCVFTPFVSCSYSNTLLNNSLSQAGSNREEIQKVLFHFKDERREAVEYTISAMFGQKSRTGIGIDSLESFYCRLPKLPTYVFDSLQLKQAMSFASLPMTTTLDLQIVTAEYIIDNTESAYYLWKNRSWNKNLSKDLFFEMLLPYRIADEPLTEWRDAYQDWLKELEPELANVHNSVDAACIVSKRIGMCPHNNQLQTPHRSALALLENPIGYCRDDCDRTIYAMRALGIPTAIDMLPVSPENGASHQWNVVYDNTDSIFRMFDNKTFFPTRDSIHNDQRRKGKVYRYTFAPDENHIKKYSKIGKFPSPINNVRLKDVTYHYFGYNKAEISVDTSEDVWLGIFTPQGFKAIDVGERISGNKIVFQNIEPELIFFPLKSYGTSYVACGNPFMLTKRGTVHEFKPDNNNVRQVKLTRKYPVRFYQNAQMETLVGVHVQSASKPSGPWTDIQTITEAPTSNYHRLDLSSPITNRFLRIYKPEGSCLHLAEVIASRDSLGQQPYDLSIYGNAHNREYYAAAVDGNILSWTYSAPAEEEYIIKINTSDPIENLFIVPHNDDNYVVPGQLYELFYFNGQNWSSIDKKIAENFYIEFRAPENAVLLLRNLSKGTEEQIFVFKNGCQLFNVDLIGKSKLF